MIESSAKPLETVSFSMYAQFLFVEIVQRLVFMLILLLLLLLLYGCIQTRNGLDGPETESL